MKIDPDKLESTIKLFDRTEAGFPLYLLSTDQYETGNTHFHDCIELVYVHSGSGTHLHDNQRYPVFAGDCFVVIPGEDHGYADSKDLYITNILFYPALLTPYIEELNAIQGIRRFFSIEPLFRSETAFRYKLHLSVSQREEMCRYCELLQHEMEHRQKGYRTLSIGIFIQMIVFLGRCYESYMDDDIRDIFDSKEQIVSSAIQYLEQNYVHDIRVGDIAHHAFISPSRLSHVFKEKTGMSLFDYLTRLRMDRAYKMLEETNKSIAEVSLSLGIQNPAYFTRFFKKIAGESPTGYRKRKQK